MKTYKYAAFYSGRETVIEANSSYNAQLKAVAFFNPPKSKKHLVHVHLIEKDNETVEIPTDF